jgi:uncharacterized protein YdhG (YjbR/CyaY superfamily)
MSQQEVDAYLAALEEPKQSTLRTLRKTILEILPEAEQCISYAIPGFRVGGQMIAGFAAFKNHLSYFPHSGSVIPKLHDDVGQYVTNKGTLQFPIDAPLPKALVEKLVTARMRQAFPGGHP